jgi:hypothetical protein
MRRKQEVPKAGIPQTAAISAETTGVSHKTPSYDGIVLLG